VDVEAKGKFPHRFSMDLLGQLMESIESSTPDAVPMGRIGIVGGDATLHNILCSYASWKVNAPQIFEQLDLRYCRLLLLPLLLLSLTTCFLLHTHTHTHTHRFYFIPTEASEIASFLSTYDGWFGRHTFVAIQTALRLFPSLGEPRAFHLPSNVDKERLQKLQGELDRSIEKLKSMSLHQQQQPQTDNNEPSHSRGEVPELPEQRRKASTNPDPDATVMSAPSPGRLIRAELENFFRQAKWKIDINISVCECWMQRSK
jgi:hypothetical protein